MMGIVNLARSVVAPYWTQTGRAAASNLLWLGAFSIASHACGIFSLIILSSSLGPALFGILSVGLAIQPILSTLGTAGTRQIIVRDGARPGADFKTLAGTHFLVTFFCSTLTALVTIGIVLAAPLSSEERFLLALFAIGNIGLCLNVAPLFDARHLQPATALTQLIIDVGGLAVILTLLATSNISLLSITWLVFAKWALTPLVSIVLYQRNVGPISPKYSWPQLKATLQSSWPILLAGLLFLIPSNCGILFVWKLHGDADAGIFGIAQPICAGYLALGMLALRIAEPHIPGPHGMKTSFILKLAAFSLSYLTALLVLVLIGSTFAVTFLLEPTYRAAFFPLAIILVAMFILSLSGIAITYLVALHCERAVMWAFAISSIVFLVAAAFLVPPLSYNGAALATLCSYSTGALISFVWTYLAWRHRNFEFADVAPSPTL